MVSEACSDTGPILHLDEVGRISLLQIFRKLFVTREVEKELAKHKCKELPRHLKVEKPDKNQVELLCRQFELDLGESSTLALCSKLQIQTMLTDDLDAREIAVEMGLQPVGSIGIVLRNFREKKLTKKQTILVLKALFEDSSLFVTSSLIELAIKEVKKFR